MYDDIRSLQTIGIGLVDLGIFGKFAVNLERTSLVRSVL